MKKTLLLIISLVLIAALAAGLAGCGSDNAGSDKKDDTSSTPAATESAGGAITADDVKFTYNGTTVELDGDADAAVAALGEADDVSSQLSCHANEGDDKTYTYKGFVLNTYPVDGKDHVLEIVIKEKGIPTARGIEVGDAVSYVTDAYGTDYKEVGMYYAYDAGDGKSLQFFIQDDKVQEISYYYDV